MSTAPVMPAYRAKGSTQQELTDSDTETLQLGDQDDRLVNRLAPARGVVVGVAISAAAWAGLILASAALFR